MSWYWKSFPITRHLWGETTNHWWIRLIKVYQRRALMFPLCRVQNLVGITVLKCGWQQIKNSLATELCEKCDQLEQLECLRSASCLPVLLSHIGSQVKKRQSQRQSYKFKEFAKISNFLILKQTLHMTRQTFCSCLIRCANMKWIWQVLLKIQSRHDSVHRRTDRWTDGQGGTSITPFQLPWNGGIINH